MLIEVLLKALEPYGFSKMMKVILSSLVTSVLAPALAVQVPLRSGRLQDYHNIHTDGDPVEWSLNRLPNPNDTDHLVFETVYSLLQHWPNTRMRNGHNIVPGVIPKGTTLYHGTTDNELPTGPEWVATEPEHAYLFCQYGLQTDLPQSECWQLTLTTTRPLKVLYFDGSSAAKIPYGSMDTGDLLAWGKITPADDIFNEWKRAEDLCKWGNSFDVDGFVRMEINFEVILCDFTSGVSVVSLANVVNWEGIPPVSPTFVLFEAMNTGSWNNHFPGETRVQLDLAGLVSLYDTQLAPSLIPIRVGQERWDHRTGNISGRDWSAVKARVEATLVRPPNPSSGIDWRALFRVLVNRFAGRLELTRHLLNSSTENFNDILEFANKTQTQLRVMLTPYMLASAMPANPPDTTNLDWALPIYRLCATTHTKYIETQLESMTDSEKLLLQAVRGTNREICRVVTKMWAGGVYSGIDQLLNTKDPLHITEITRIRNQWAEDLNHLMEWLDWSVWAKCDPKCGPEEMCYLPTWPIGFPWFLPVAMRAGCLSEPIRQKRWTGFGVRTAAMEQLAQGMSNDIQAGSDDWIRPEPRCIKRVDPYDLEPFYYGKIPPAE